MPITRNTLETNPSSAEWFTGLVFGATWREHVTNDEYAQAPTPEGGDR